MNSVFPNTESADWKLAEAVYHTVRRNYVTVALGPGAPVHLVGVKAMICGLSRIGGEEIKAVLSFNHAPWCESVPMHLIRVLEAKLPSYAPYVLIG